MRIFIVLLVTSLIALLSGWLLGHIYPERTDVRLFGGAAVFVYFLVTPWVVEIVYLAKYRHPLPVLVHIALVPPGLIYLFAAVISGQATQEKCPSKVQVVSNN